MMYYVLLSGTKLLSDDEDCGGHRMATTIVRNYLLFLMYCTVQK